MHRNRTRRSAKITFLIRSSVSESNIVGLADELAIISKIIERDVVHA